MPWYVTPMKDAVGCDKLRRAVKQAMTRRFPNGITQPRRPVDDANLQFYNLQFSINF